MGMAKFVGHGDGGQFGDILSDDYCERKQMRAGNNAKIIPLLFELFATPWLCDNDVAFATAVSKIWTDVTARAYLPSQAVELTNVCLGCVRVCVQVGPYFMRYAETWIAYLNTFGTPRFVMHLSTVMAQIVLRLQSTVDRMQELQVLLSPPPSLSSRRASPLTDRVAGGAGGVDGLGGGSPE